MTTTPDLGLPLIVGQQAQPEVTYSEALIRLQALLSGVIDRGVNTPPGGPTEGDGYIIGAAPTGAWAGKVNKIAIFYGGSWRFVPDVDSNGSDIPIGARHEGLRAWVRDENLLYVWDGAAWGPLSTGAVSYDFGFSLPGVPDAGAVLGKVVVPRDITIPADMAGSAGHVDVNPDATFLIDVTDDGVSIGTITVSTGGVFSFSTSGGTLKQVVAGSVVRFVAPASSPPEASISGVAATLRATQD